MMVRRALEPLLSPDMSHVMMILKRREPALVILTNYLL
jgi:hypothetical protein